MTHDRKASITARFNAAAQYDRAARVQKRCATQLAHWIEDQHTATPPSSILELGCGTGFLTAELHRAFPQATLCATDLAPEMLTRTRERLGPTRTLLLRVMDGEHPHTDWPATQTPPFDLIASSLCWQWFTDRPAALARLTALLAPGGRLMVTTLLQHSLDEWRESCRATHTPCGVPDYPSLGQLEREWPSNGSGTWQEQILTDSVPSARNFLQGLRAIGATLPPEHHRPARGLALKEAMRWFDRHHHSVTYRVGFGLFQKHA